MRAVGQARRVARQNASNLPRFCITVNNVADFPCQTDKTAQMTGAKAGLNAGVWR